MVGALPPQLDLDLGDLLVEVVDQLQTGGDVRPPRFGEVELGEPPASLLAEQIRRRAGMPERMSEAWIRFFNPTR